jgi:hypothetical protein
VVARWFVVDSHFFSTFLSFPIKVHVCPFFFLFSFSALIFFIIYFHHWPFWKVFYVFNSVLKLQFVIYIFSQIRSLFFWFVIFTLGSFVNVLSVFNFILQSKFMLLFFQFSLHSFDFFFSLLIIFFFSI